MCESFNKKLFIEHELLSFLINLVGGGNLSVSQSQSGSAKGYPEQDNFNFLTLDEIKLMSRIFASMMPETLISSQMLVIPDDKEGEEATLL